MSESQAQHSTQRLMASVLSKTNRHGIEVRHVKADLVFELAKDWKNRAKQFAKSKGLKTHRAKVGIPETVKNRSTGEVYPNQSWVEAGESALVYVREWGRPFYVPLNRIGSVGGEKPATRKKKKKYVPKKGAKKRVTIGTKKSFKELDELALYELEESRPPSKKEKAAKREILRECGKAQAELVERLIESQRLRQCAVFYKLLKDDEFATAQFGVNFSYERAMAAYGDYFFDFASCRETIAQAELGELGYGEYDEDALNAIQAIRPKVREFMEWEKEDEANNFFKAIRLAYELHGRMPFSTMEFIEEQSQRKKLGLSDLGRDTVTMARELKSNCWYPVLKTLVEEMLAHYGLDEADCVWTGRI